MTYTFIICAGKQHRFESTTPKAVVDINGKTLLSMNIETAQQCSDKIVVVASNENYPYFESYESENVHAISIESGYGCGDAVLQALNSIEYDPEDDCYIMWGDSLQTDASLYTRCKSVKSNCVIPVIREESPYVQIVANDDNEIIAAKFSKYKEHIDKNSFHDLSFFYGKIDTFKRALVMVKRHILKNDEYVCKHGNELTFLDIFNYPNCFTQNDHPTVLEDPNNKSFSFNTVEELEKIINELK